LNRTKSTAAIVELHEVHLASSILWITENGTTCMKSTAGLSAQTQADPA
jgi:hypothetical protein